jgi:hypothetical protein
MGVLIMNMDEEYEIALDRAIDGGNISDAFADAYELGYNHGKEYILGLA